MKQPCHIPRLAGWLASLGEQHSSGPAQGTGGARGDERELARGGVEGDVRLCWRVTFSHPSDHTHLWVTFNTAVRQTAHVTLAVVYRGRRCIMHPRTQTETAVEAALLFCASICLLPHFSCDNRCQNRCLSLRCAFLAFVK